MTDAPAQIPRRHVHLDFHTSPLIPDVGADFDPEGFADTLARAHVQSINLFAKCHHGYSYYPTEVGTTHPHLHRDLLGEQIAACQARDIRTVAYTTVVWDEVAATAHADWLQLDRQGTQVGRRPLEAPEAGWRYLCMNSPYIDHLLAHTEEFCRRYPLHGVWFDIVWQTSPGCVCNHCLTSMERLALDPTNDEDLALHSRLIGRAFVRRASTLVRSINPQATLFYNGRLAIAAEEEDGIRPELDDLTHVEIESVPSGGWGYNHFPVFARYFQTLDRPIVGMTTAFHKVWGDFGTVKNAAALAYEAQRVAAAGAAISVGDQLHPRGVLNPATYEPIGAVFAALERLEPWLIGAVPLADIGVLVTPQRTWGHGALSESEEGAMRACAETYQQFQLLDRRADLAPYRVVVAPDSVTLDEAWARGLSDYLEGGGTLLLTGDSGLTADGGGFALDQFGVQDHGPSAYAPEYARWLAQDSRLDRPDGLLAALDHMIMYEQGRAVTPLAGATVLASVVHPYFNRRWDHYSSHRQTPPDLRPTKYAAVVLAEGGRVAYCAHPLFAMYRRHAYVAHRQILVAVLRRLLPEPLVRFDGPSTAEVTVLRQDVPRRTVCHLLHYVPQRRADGLDVIEDVIPLHDRTLSVRLEQAPARAYVAPDELPLEISWQAPYATVRIPIISGHAVIVFEDR